MRRCKRLARRHKNRARLHGRQAGRQRDGHGGGAIGCGGSATGHNDGSSGSGGNGTGACSGAIDGVVCGGVGVIGARWWRAGPVATIVGDIDDTSSAYLPVLLFLFFFL